jgi:hypothetical protein
MICSQLRLSPFPLSLAEESPRSRASARSRQRRCWRAKSRRLGDPHTPTHPHLTHILASSITPSLQLKPLSTDFSNSVFANALPLPDAVAL